ncbi:MAG TPA: penicillin-binding protein activator [Methylophilaceae bacterium]|nr:penicillin-binding protein activator [Methylophilaceae bacterium]
MAQRLLALFLLLNCLLPCNAPAAESAKTSTPAAAKPQKSPEQRYLDGLACMQQADTPCAQVALAGINPASPYAKILEAQIAAASQDYDTVLRLLIPLRTDTGLLPQASASLHATLAQAYEIQDNPLRALEQFSRAGSYLSAPADIEANQSQIWQMLAGQPKETLLQMRGESQDTVTQGWIDLALAVSYSPQPEHDLTRWRSAYPGHPASSALLEKISAGATVDAPAPASSVEGKVALLLPLENPAYAAVAEALRGGFLTAFATAKSTAELQVYSTHGNKDQIVPSYQLAVQEGAGYIVGPLVREEVSTLAASGAVTATTLALNQPEGKPVDKLILFGRPVEAEARQVAGIGRRLGMQSALVVVADTPLAKRMAEAFASEWKAQQGTLDLELAFSANTHLAELKAQAISHPADMIFLAADAEQARRVRPYLDQATPTFGTSHLYDGDAGNPLNLALDAVHFVDMPWLIEPAAPQFAPYRQVALKFPGGEMQRWFALGVDAWGLLSGGSGTPLQGLTGDIRWEQGQPVRELSMAQFRGERVVSEPLP